MALATTAVDDPATLLRLLSAAPPSHSHVGRLMDAGRAHAALSAAPSTAKAARDLQLQQQRAQQSAWAVSAARALVLPALRTMAPSFTKASDAGRRAFGGTVVGGAGFHTIIAMVPTAANTRRIADEDELISSFRPYRLDALRAARAACRGEAESAPHPDEARQLAPTLAAAAPNRLLDAAAIPDAVAAAHRQTAAAFAAAAAAPRSPTPSGRAAPETAARQTRHDGTSSFLATGRRKAARAAKGVRQPPLGHYHIRYALVDPRVRGGCVAPPPAPPPNRRHVPDTPDAPDAPPVLAESTREFGLSLAARSVTAPAPPDPPAPRGTAVFCSRTPRANITAGGTAARDLDYWPYPDARSTCRRTRGAVRFGGRRHSRRHAGVVARAVVGMYDVAGDMGRGRWRQMARQTGRQNDWRRAASPSAAGGDVAEVGRALAATRPRVRAVSLAARAAETAAPPPDPTVSIERDLQFPRSTFDPRRARRVRRFSTMVGRERYATPGAHEAPEHVEFALVTRRSPAAAIHPRAPGHAPLHRPNPTEMGDVPDLDGVRPNTLRVIKFGVGGDRSFAGAHMHDLSYDTERRELVEPRVQGNPMIETQVSRDRRAKIFSTAGCGAHAVYKTDIPFRSKSVPVFEKQITKETQFCGHRLQSERWERHNPKAPGPGHYDVSYKLVEKKL